MRSFVLVVLVAAGAAASCDGPTGFGGSAVEVRDADVRDGPCDDASVPSERCGSNADCVASVRSHGPVGVAYVVCFHGFCANADRCVQTNAGGPDYCRCGDADLTFGCDGLCLQQSGVAAPSCVAACF